MPCQPQAISSRCIFGGQALGHQRGRAHAAQVVGRHVAVEGINAALAAGAPEELAGPKPTEAATQSAAQAAMATGLANSTASGLRIRVSSSSAPGIDLGEVGEDRRSLSRQGSRSPPPASTSPGSRKKCAW